MLNRAIRYIRWRAHLRSLHFHLDDVRRLEDHDGGNFIICGVPRSGTTLLCGALLQLPRIVTVMEPWDGLRMSAIELFNSLRDEIRDTGAVCRGKLDLDVLRSRRQVRWAEEGSQRISVSEPEEVSVGVKWPTFWQYLGILERTKFLVCIRHPYDVVASFKKVGGRLGHGLEYDVRFNRRMNRDLASMAATDWQRRVHFYEYVNSRALKFADHSNVFIVKFEEWFEDPSGLIESVSSFLEVELSPPPVQINQPMERQILEAKERSLINEVCDSARTLGYL